MNRHTPRTTLFAFALAVLPTIVVHAQSSYSSRDLGNLGGSLATPFCVNNAGQVVGYSNLASGIPHGFFWSSATGMVDMGSLVGSTGGSQADGINNLGDVVGSSSVADPLNSTHAILWNSSTRVLVDLNSLLSPTDAANWVLGSAWKINDNRQVIGNGKHTLNGTVSSEGFLLDLSTTPATLTDLGAFNPAALNNLASPWVVGSNSGQTYLYPGALPLLSLAPMVVASGVNNAGGIVGYLSSGDPAYISPSGVLTVIASLRNVTAGPDSINNASPAVVVGRATTAFRWVVGSSAMQDLNKLTSGLGKLTLLQGRSVSDTGYIACWAVDPATNYHAVLLTPQ